MNTIHGGHAVDYAPIDRAPRRWPQIGKGTPSPDDPRPVRIEITSWVGISFGAKHTYLKIEEEFNYIRDDNQSAWVKPWDDNHGKGISAEMNLASEEQALAVARAFVVACGFDGPGYRLQWDVSNNARKQIKMWKLMHANRTGD